MHYPTIDVSGVDKHRMRLFKPHSASMRIGKTVMAGLGELSSPNYLLDPERAKHYANYLLNRGKNGRDVLHDIKLSLSAILCAASVMQDHGGIDMATPAIHTMMEHIKGRFSDPNFGQVQSNKEFVSNVFGLQYGYNHSGIPEACNALGITCIELNTTRFTREELDTKETNTNKLLERIRTGLKNLEGFNRNSKPLYPLPARQRIESLLPPPLF
jgi:hypothetical protein